MLHPRIIPCLLVHDKGLVKTVNFKHPKYVGDPINAVRIFNEKEVDELIVLDIDATVENHEPNFKMIEHLATECRMPLCYGGGIKTLEQAHLAAPVDFSFWKKRFLYSTTLYDAKKADLQRAQEIMIQYADTRVGLVDAAVIAVAVLTFAVWAIYGPSRVLHTR